MSTVVGKTIVLGGRTGLLGRSLVPALAEADGVAEVLPTGREELDVTSEGAVAEFLDRERPDTLMNAVAYTAVDQAEDEPEAARLLNAAVPAILGRQCMERGILLVHYSTDFVFGGQGLSPLSELNAPDPSSVYGATKLEGEGALRELGYDNLLILRTSWLFGPGKTNFVHKILGLAREREFLTVVDDQVGSPTYAPDLALHTLELIENDARGLFHLANSEPASWFELAAEAVRLAGIDCEVRPVPTSAYPTKARRPAYSVLDTAAFTAATGTTPRPWKEALQDYVESLRN